MTADVCYVELARRGCSHDGPSRDSDGDPGGRGDYGSNDDNGRNGGGRRDRVPRGSGCDDPGDFAEHAERRT